ncbi:MAG TPA: hypothetical protein VFD36_29575 [Kofleriaceae bacterium]|nr:hypothetical protein [Kofleriaceae bacterium]
MDDLRKNRTPAIDQHVLTEASLKRIAWAFGCAKKGSTEEAQLEELLVARLRDAA